jgi:hypothetical protein
VNWILIASLTTPSSSPGSAIRLALQCTAGVEARDDLAAGADRREYNLDDATSRPEEESWRP